MVSRPAASAVKDRVDPQTVPCDPVLLEILAARQTVTQSLRAPDRQLDTATGVPGANAGRSERAHGEYRDRGQKKWTELGLVGPARSVELFYEGKNVTPLNDATDDREIASLIIEAGIRSAELSVQDVPYFIERKGGDEIVVRFLAVPGYDKIIEHIRTSIDVTVRAALGVKQKAELDPERPKDVGEKNGEAIIKLLGLDEGQYKDGGTANLHTKIKAAVQAAEARTHLRKILSKFVDLPLSLQGGAGLWTFLDQNYGTEVQEESLQGLEVSDLPTQGLGDDAESYILQEPSLRCPYRRLLDLCASMSTGATDRFNVFGFDLAYTVVDLDEVRPLKSGERVARLDHTVSGKKSDGQPPMTLYIPDDELD